jgi:hypothetical protein
MTSRKRPALPSNDSRSASQRDYAAVLQEIDEQSVADIARMRSQGAKNTEQIRPKRSYTIDDNDNQEIPPQKRQRKTNITEAQIKREVAHTRQLANQRSLETAAHQENIESPAKEVALMQNTKNMKISSQAVRSEPAISSRSKQRHIAVGPVPLRPRDFLEQVQKQGPVLGKLMSKDPGKWLLKVHTVMTKELWLRLLPYVLSPEMKPMSKARIPYITLADSILDQNVNIGKHVQKVTIVC